MGTIIDGTVINPFYSILMVRTSSGGFGLVRVPCEHVTMSKYLALRSPTSIAAMDYFL